MVKSNINYFGIIGCAIVYSATCFASAFIGFVNPWCWIVVFPVLAAVLGAPSYLWAVSRWQRFGVATLFSSVLAALLLSMGEINLTQTALMVIILTLVVAYMGISTFSRLRIGRDRWT